MLYFFHKVFCCSIQNRGHSEILLAPSIQFLMSETQMSRTPPDISQKTNEELEAMIQQLHQDAQKLGRELEDSHTRLRSAQSNFKNELPDVVTLQGLAKRRLERFDKIFRLKKRIVAIAMRYPGLFEVRSAQIISNNLSLMRRQFELALARHESVSASFAEADRHRADLEQKLAKAAGVKRHQEGVLMQRDHEKAELVKTLRRELEDAEKTFDREFRIANRAVAELRKLLTTINAEVVAKRQEYQNLCSKRFETAASRALGEKRQELIQATEAFLEFWDQRRKVRYWQDCQDVLTRAMTETTSRRSECYASIKKVHEANQVAETEKEALLILKKEMEKNLKEVEEKQANVKREVDELVKKKAIPHYTAEENTKIEKLKAELDELEKQAKMAELEVRTYEGAYAGPTRGEMRYAKERLIYRRELRAMGDLMLEIQKEKERAEKGKESSRELANIGNPRLVVSEDGDDVVIEAAPLDVLAAMLFHPDNIDKNYMYSILVLIHTETKDISIDDFVKIVVKAYEDTDYCGTRREKLSELMDKWMQWFPGDFQNSQTKMAITPLFNLLGSSGVVNLQPSSSDNVIWDSSVPYNRDQPLVFCAPPLVLAEHFAYFELQILRDIPASEFIKNGWTALDKWERSPHICKMMEHFNTVSTWIVKSLVTEGREGRARMLEKWIQVMEAAREISNYQLVFEIFGALCSPAIIHLKKTWKKVSPETVKTFEALRTLTTATARFLNYRLALEETAKEITVPYIGPMLTSLVYVNDGNTSKKTIQDSTETFWNMVKFRGYAQIMREIESDWGSAMQFVLNPELFTLISSMAPPKESDGELFQKARQLREDA